MLGLLHWWELKPDGAPCPKSGEEGGRRPQGRAVISDSCSPPSRRANAEIAQVRGKAQQEQAAYQASLRKEQLRVDALERTLEQKVPGPGAGLARAAGVNRGWACVVASRTEPARQRLARHEAMPPGPGFALLPAETAACLPSFIPRPIRVFVKRSLGT